jgi:hypothetical protein
MKITPDYVIRAAKALALASRGSDLFSSIEYDHISGIYRRIEHSVDEVNDWLAVAWPAFEPLAVKVLEAAKPTPFELRKASYEAQRTA